MSIDSGERGDSRPESAHYGRARGGGSGLARARAVSARTHVGASALTAAQTFASPRASAAPRSGDSVHRRVTSAHGTVAATHVGAAAVRPASAMPSDAGFADRVGAGGATPSSVPWRALSAYTPFYKRVGGIACCFVVGSGMFTWSGCDDRCGRRSRCPKMEQNVRDWPRRSHGVESPETGTVRTRAEREKSVCSAPRGHASHSSICGCRNPRGAFQGTA